MACRQVSTYNGVSGSGRQGGGGYVTEADCLNACKEGACCESNGTCSVKPQCQCQGTGQTFKGVGTACAPNICYPCGSDTRPKYIYATLSGSMSASPSGNTATYPSTQFTMQRIGCNYSEYTFSASLQGARCFLQYESADSAMRFVFDYADFYSDTTFINCQQSLFGGGQFLTVTAGETQRPRNDAANNAFSYVAGPATYRFLENTANQSNSWGWIVGKSFQETIRWRIGTLGDFVTPCVAEMSVLVTIDGIGN